jgi:uncharacterized membrane protein
MILLQLAALGIVLLYVLSCTVGQAGSLRLLSRLCMVSVACWITEETCIRFYGFYSYSPTWSLFLGHVPILIILIWPPLIHSSWNLASQLLNKQTRLLPLAAAGVVFTDALLIEPVAVNAGLWSWSEPGIFHVPPIGILGWGIFAFLCTLFFQKGTSRNASKKQEALILVFPVIATHALLLGIWWGGLRWISMDVPSALMVGAAWILSIVVTLTFLRRGTGRHVKKKTLLLRVPAALFFLVLLISNARGSGMLIVYILASVPPYITLMVQQYRRS